MAADCLLPFVSLQRADPCDLELLSGCCGLNALFSEPQVLENEAVGREQGILGTLGVPSPGRWRSSESATWTPTTLCWRRTRRWTWSTGCCSTSCTRGTGWRCTAPERAGCDGPAGSLLVLVWAEESPGHPQAAGPRPSRLPSLTPSDCVLQGLGEPCQVGGSQSHSR